jgi:N-acetylmuramoyl-L-alanine amidase
VTDIPLDRPALNGLLYRIQMGAFSKPIEPDKFGGIVPICGETVQNTTIIKYYAGTFNHISDAEKALIKIREYGFKDAYVVSFYNGKIIPINRAKEIEKEVQ